ncbi:hemin importer ATP-binding subunit [Methylophaga lonarensis MPL]|uniref:Hemin importer ATP-binding subunit n=1 Tax=Methylophaga lonarensis MPL TaxID=1286106 RepID=M7NZA5_9GAMM|nr:heme ABC transporter ATP-binding protein [Methylophaga lonarensis]EMR14163.1 hemin importer ATP-binding subunit [Methylophaga lonarensis MPL]
MNTLQIKHIKLVRANRQLLDVSNLATHSGELIAILGPNGAGKSSLLKVISGEWHAQAADILIHGRSRQQWARNQLAGHLGVLPQSSSLNFPFTVEEVVLMGAIPLALSRQEARIKAQQLMQTTDTSQFADRLYTSLSGGERQRVQLARVLLQLSQAQSAPVLLLDEPLSAQDLSQQHQLMSLMQQLAHQQQATILVVLHDLNHALRYADRIWLMNSGHLCADGAPSDILQPDKIAELWGYRPQLLTGEHHSAVLY